MQNLPMVKGERHALIEYFPPLTAADLSFDVSEVYAVELPPEIGVPPPPSPTATRLVDEPTFTPYTVAPRLKNRDHAAHVVRMKYPKILQNAGIGGTVVVWAFGTQLRQACFGLGVHPHHF